MGSRSWKGGDLWVPQLDARLKVKSGDVVSLLTRNLVHCGTEIKKGSRLVFTLFTDRQLLENGLAALSKE